MSCGPRANTAIKPSTTPFPNFQISTSFSNRSIQNLRYMHHFHITFLSSQNASMCIRQLISPPVMYFQLMLNMICHIDLLPILQKQLLPPLTERTPKTANIHLYDQALPVPVRLPFSVIVRVWRTVLLPVPSSGKDNHAVRELPVPTR